MTGRVLFIQWGIGSVFALCLGFSAEARPKYIRLLPSDASQKLEDLNKGDGGCVLNNKFSIEESLAYQKCRKKSYKPLIEKLEVRERPDAAAPVKGQIIVTWGMETGISAKYLENGKDVDLKSDSTETDPGYDGFFEFTVVKEEGDWIQLPKRPFDKPVWINPKLNWGAKRAPVAQDLGIGQVVDSPVGSIVILDFSKDEVVYRRETEADFDCENPSPGISPEGSKQRRAPLKDFYDSDGHLLAWMKYTRGC